MKTQQPLNPKHQAIARTFTYTSTAILSGAMVYLLMNNLVPLTEMPNTVGTAVLIVFSVVFAGLTFLLSRRYTRKKFGYPYFPYVIAVLVLIPTIILVQIKSEVFATTSGELFFFLGILIGSILGAYKGVQKGEEQIKEETAYVARSQRAKDVPEELSNPDEVSKN